MKYSFLPLLAVVCSIGLGSCVTRGKFNNLQSQYTNLSRDYQECQIQSTQSRTLVTGLEDRLEEARRNNDDLRNALNQCLAQASQGNVNIGKLVDEINASNRFIQHLVEAKNRSDSLNMLMISNLTRSLTPTESQDIDIQVLKGVVYISLDDKMLYRSGSYEISDKAGQILSKIAKIILDYKDYDVLVEGNTDTDPISRTNIRNNWDLSVLRGHQ